VSDGRLLRRLLLVSLLLRLLVWIPVARYHVPAVFDETGYAARARAYAACTAALLHGRAPAETDRDAAYDGGFQPPLHPLLLGLWSLPGRGGTGWLRLWPVLLTALATPLVWRVGRRLAGRRAAHVAAALHLLSPTVTFFSHTLWSEPLFTLLLLGAVDRLLAAADAATAGVPSRPRSRAPALAAGLLLGLAGVTRVEGALLLPLAALWLWRRSGRAAARTVVPVLVVGLLPLLAWEAVLVGREGRFVPLTTSGSLNLLLGNTALVPTAAGSAWRDTDVQAVLRERVAAAADSLGIGRDAACRRLAVAEIVRRPGRALLRAAARLRLYWAPDLFPVRHVAQVVYPPVPDAVLLAVWLGTTLFYLAVAGLVVAGLLRGAVRERSLLAAVAAALLLPAVATIAMSRLHFPLLVLLLPAAGGGWDVLRRRRPPGRLPDTAVAGLTALVLVTIVSAIPVQLRRHLEPSWYHHRLLDRVADRLGYEARYGDLVLLRAAGEAAPREMAIVSQDTLRWRPADRRWLPVSVRAGTGRPPRLELVDPATGRSCRLRPVAREHWRRWRPVGGDGFSGVEFQWAGGG